MVPANLASFGAEGLKFRAAFEAKSDAHLVIASLLLKDADLSGVRITQMLQTSQFDVVSQSGEQFRDLGPFEINERTVQRIIKQFVTGLSDVAKRNAERQEKKRKAAQEGAGLQYTAPDLSDKKVLAERVYASLGSRAGKPRKRFHVETKASRAKAAKEAEKNKPKLCGPTVSDLANRDHL